jgi:hypothetical protein
MARNACGCDTEADGGRGEMCLIHETLAEGHRSTREMDRNGD